jgi:S-DNA-T family DNA segregation ATPase FtsK/SpoIIIE
MLVGSMTGGGKSILLKIILTYLITKKKIDLYLLDFKGSEFFVFENCSCIKKICYDPEDALNMFIELTNIMKERYKKFKDKGVRDIWDFNNKYKFTKMRHIVIVADEYSELMEYKDCQREMERLTQLGRAAGFNLIICTQRPDSKVVNGRIKNNFSVVAGLKTNDAINSRIIIDNDSLSKLKGKGHCIFRYGGVDTVLQVMKITDEKIKELIKPFEINKEAEKKKTIQNGELNEEDFNKVVNLFEDRPKNNKR